MLVEINGTLLKMSKVEAIGPINKTGHWYFKVFISGPEPLTFTFNDLTEDSFERDKRCIEARENLVSKWTQFIKWQSTLNISKYSESELFL